VGGLKLAELRVQTGARPRTPTGKCGAQKKLPRAGDPACT